MTPVHGLMLGEKPGGAEDEEPRDCVEEGPLGVVCFLRFFLEGDGVVDERVLVPGEEPLVAPWTGGGGGAPRCAWAMRVEAACSLADSARRCSSIWSIERALWKEGKCL